MDNESRNEPPEKIRYRWPWFLAAFILVGVLLACWWMSREIEKTARIRDANAPAPNSAR
jgi:hypothetical protein